MCGIAGLWTRSSAPADRAVVAAMTRTLRHRGPNDEGYVLINTRSGQWSACSGAETMVGIHLPPLEAPREAGYSLVMGHRRLAVIDVTVAGHQPMGTSDGRWWIVYNGELYNYRELRLELTALGATFDTETDTEVVLQAYRQWGVGCLSRFNGMWAFAIWDERHRQLVCARDRFGIKPLYYAWHDGAFYWASEPKALIASLPHRPKPNAAIVYDYLLGIGLDHTADTFYAGVQQLLPGHYLIVTEDGSVRAERWYQLTATRTAYPAIWCADEQLRSLIESAVAQQLHSDVPLGTCLSGGLDSSTIACLVNRFRLQPERADATSIGPRLKTFSACSSDPRFDERRFSDAVAQAAETEPHRVYPDAAGLWQELPRLIAQQDEPFASTSIYAQWCVMRAAAQAGVTVLLDGQGNDEVFAGYEVYFAIYLTELLRTGQWMALRRELDAAWATWGRALAPVYGRALVYAAPPPVHRALWWRARRQTLAVLRPAFARSWRARAEALIETHYHSAADLPQRLVEDVTTYRLPQLLRYEDRNSMAFSIESRVPYLDHRYVEYACRLPAAYKVHGGWGKWIMRESLQGVLPEVVRWRRDKKGFVTPEVDWLRAHQERIAMLFGASSVASEAFLNITAVGPALAAALGDQTAEGTSEVWRWVNLEWWLQQLEGQAAPAEAEEADASAALHRL